MSNKVEKSWMCDACAGQGDNKNCMCGGSGLAVDAVVYLRNRVHELEKQLADPVSDFDMLVKMLTKHVGSDGVLKIHHHKVTEEYIKVNGVTTRNKVDEELPSIDFAPYGMDTYETNFHFSADGELTYITSSKRY